jgi:Na+/H+-dicarboxylate symporter/ABC-type amino acid transport substrate-binding protein
VAITANAAVGETPPKRSVSFSTKIVIGLVAGVVLGLFIGERAAALQVAADAYIKLLQMTVLPYVTVSLIVGIGSLRLDEARKLGLRVGAVLVMLWVVALVAVFLFPLMFPPLETASFFSTTLVEKREPLDLVNLYIPANPFNSLANNVVPAVVLFSVVVGIALIGIPRKAVLLDALTVANEAVSKATRFVVALTPYGMFAIAAVAAGTLALEDVERLQIYLISYIAISLLLSLWVLPGLVAALTPIPYGPLLSKTRDALVTAFMTSSLFVVLPMLTDETKRLVREHGGLGTQHETLPEVIIPASFNFPHTGKLLSLSFVLFAGWFADAIVPLSSYPKLAGTGLLVLFGNMNVAIPFLLDFVRVPADTFQLFLATSVVNARFGTLMSAVHTLAVAVLGTCAVTGLLRVDGRRLLRFGVITAVLTIVTVGGARLLFTFALAKPYDKDKVLAGMQMLRDRGDAVVIRPGQPAPPIPAVTTSVLDRVRARHTLRVGYFDNSLPYAFFNHRGDLVGLDVEMAHQLARDLGVALELVPIARLMGRTLDSSSCDIVMSGTAVTADWAMNVLYSSPYLDETMAFIVPDHLRAAFSEWSSVRAMGKVRIGVPRAPYYIRKLQEELPEADIVPVDSIDVMFARRDSSMTAFVATAERGSAYTLLHPEFSVVVPQPRPLKVPLAYIIASEDQPLATVVNTWVDLKRKDGTIDRLFAHWILGQEAVAHVRRWSIMDNVLHW